MNYVKQAYELESRKKEVAKRLYAEATMELVNKDYTAGISKTRFHAHDELSAIFGGMWFEDRVLKDNAVISDDLFAEANVAFNYANLTNGFCGRFTDYAKELVEDSSRIGDKKLATYTKQMYYVLTNTTVEEINYNGNVLKAKELM